MKYLSDHLDLEPETQKVSSKVTPRLSFLLNFVVLAYLVHF